jgi:DNA-binding NarL/FixJ family response regulator
MRVLVLGAVRLYREGLTALLPIKADAEVVTAGCGRDDLSAHQLGADVIVVDGAAIGCLDIVRSISRIVPAARVLLVGAPQSEQESWPGARRSFFAALHVTSSPSRHVPLDAATATGSR